MTVLEKVVRIALKTRSGLAIYAVSALSSPLNMASLSGGQDQLALVRVSID